MHRPPPRLILVAAIARNGAIGRDNALLWSDRADLQRLRRVTLAYPVIMGRRTWDSLPARFRPLPGRRNIVVSRNPAWQADGAERMASFDAAMESVAGCEQACVIGGAQLYALALPRADRLVLTEIDADLDGDTHFPPWNRLDYTRVECESHLDAHGTPYRFTVYDRNWSTPHV